MKTKSPLQIYLRTKLVTFDLKLKKFFRYSEILKRWVEISVDEIAKEIRLFDPSLKENKIKEEISKYGSINTAIFNEGKNFCFLNGFFKIGSRDFHKYSEKTYLYPTVDYCYVEGSESTLFNEKIDEIFQGDKAKINTFLDYASLALDNEVNFPGVILLIGDGANGKSLLLNTLRNVFGNRVSCLAVEELDDKFKNSQLIDAHINISEENDASFTSSRLNLIKSLTSGTERTFEEKFKKPSVHHVKVVFMFSLNQPPKIVEQSNAVSRRFRVLNFSRIFSEEEQDPELGQKLKNEYSAIFNQLHKRIIKIKKKGSIEVDEKIKNDTEVALKSSSPVKVFIDEKYTVSGSSKHKVVKKSLYEEFEKFCTLREFNLVGYQTFCKQVVSFENVKTGKENSGRERRQCFIGLVQKVRTRRVRRRRRNDNEK